MDVDIQAIVDQAKKNRDAEAAADQLLADLFAKLTAALAGTGPLSAADRAALQQSVADMETSRAAMAAAIVANTPSGAPPA